MIQTKTLFYAAFILIICSFFVVSCQKSKTEAVDLNNMYLVPDIDERVAQYAPTPVSCGRSMLTEEQSQVLDKLIQAAEYIDAIFWKQASFRGLELKNALELKEDPKYDAYLEYLNINYGPYDRLDAHRPFIGTEDKPAGAAFYPPEMTKEEFNEYIESHPDEKTAFESPYTLIRRQNSGLEAVPYNAAYQEELEPAARLLREAADITTNPSLKNYLKLRAEDLLKNDYYQSDIAWIDLEDNRVELVIGPYEVYEDGLMGLKAAYESFVYINDFEEMEKIAGYIDFLPEMQQNLPVEQKYKAQEVGGLASPLNVVCEVFSAGDARAGVQTLAFVLPNDERVREEKGTKKVMLKNIQEAKFNKILVPISQKVLTPEDAENVSFYAYFNETILHELCHALGVNYVTFPDGTRTTVNKALQEHYSAIEEAKATVLGIYSVPFLIQQGWIPAEKQKEIYTTYLAGMFRSLRFGLHEAHGMGTLLQYNFLREKGAVEYDESLKKYRINMEQFPAAIEELARILLILEGNGNYDDAGQFLDEYGLAEPLIEATIAGLDDIPVDIKPVFE